jgi:hypothetical protein
MGRDFFFYKSSGGKCQTPVSKFESVNSRRPGSIGGVDNQIREFTEHNHIGVTAI